ncbi:MAG TPA: MBL fold metallo-hydrolase [Candidatus Paceibacterota bacterium]
MENDSKINAHTKSFGVRAKKLKLTFVSGVTTVTGANFLLETVPETGELAVRILIDCGLEQGTRESEINNRKSFPYDVSSIDYLFITHAHIDHIGRVPKLVKDGFKGKIFSTQETHKLAPIMLEDSMKVFKMDQGEFEPLYDEKDIEDSMSLWHDIPYDTCTDIKGGIQVCAKDAGHILGSVMYEFTYNGKKIIFTGDLGNSPTPLLRDTAVITDATYLVMESVYGDRNHESTEERRDMLENIIEDASKRKGALIIPCFSLEKAQVLLYEINHLVEEGRVAPMPVYLDSPLAIKVTEIYRGRSRGFNEEVRQEMQKDENIFSFPRLTKIMTAEESKKLIDTPNPKIIIAGSGMSSGGRIIHHEINYLPDPNSTLLLTGYQSIGTLGRHIQDGAKTVTIFGNEVAVRANIVAIDGYSSHKDSDHLLAFVSDTRDTLKKVFVVMGEPKAALFLTQKIQDNLAVEAYHPQSGETVVLDF